MFGLLLDLKNPKIGWEDETKAVKQNMNVMIFMVADIVLWAPAFALIFVFDFSFTLSVVLVHIYFLGVAAILYYLIKKFGKRLYLAH